MWARVASAGEVENTQEAALECPISMCVENGETQKGKQNLNDLLQVVSLIMTLPVRYQTLVEGKVVVLGRG